MVCPANASSSPHSAMVEWSGSDPSPGASRLLKACAQLLHSSPHVRPESVPWSGELDIGAQKSRRAQILASLMSRLGGPMA